MTDIQQQQFVIAGLSFATTISGTALIALIDCPILEVAIAYFVGFLTAASVVMLLKMDNF